MVCHRHCPSSFLAPLEPWLRPYPWHKPVFPLLHLLWGQTLIFHCVDHKRLIYPQQVLGNWHGTESNSSPESFLEGRKGKRRRNGRDVTDYTEDNSRIKFCVFLKFDSYSPSDLWYFGSRLPKDYILNFSIMAMARVSKAKPSLWFLFFPFQFLKVTIRDPGPSKSWATERFIFHRVLSLCGSSLPQLTPQEGNLKSSASFSITT